MATAAMGGGFMNQIMRSNTVSLVGKAAAPPWPWPLKGFQLYCCSNTNNNNKSAVRLKHLPTGIIAQAVEDRSQHMNRASALARLRTLIALKEIRSLLNRIHRLPSFFKFFPETQRIGDLILVPKLGLTIPSLYWVCRLCLI
ncbi:hypothetical protein V6Z11_A08G267300 [Gossypium hirsutum]